MKYKIEIAGDKYAVVDLINLRVAAVTKSLKVAQALIDSLLDRENAQLAAFENNARIRATEKSALI